MWDDCFWFHLFTYCFVFSWKPNYTLLCKYTRFPLSIHQMMDIWFVSNFWLLKIKQQWSWMGECLCNKVWKGSSESIPSNWCSCMLWKISFQLWGYSNSMATLPVCTPTRSTWVFPFPHTLACMCCHVSCFGLIYLFAWFFFIQGILTGIRIPTEVR